MIGAVLKTVVRASVPWVRIPSPPPYIKEKEPKNGSFLIYKGSHNITKRKIFMKIQKISSTNQSFQALHVSQDVPKVLNTAIENSPAMKKFAKKYDAVVGYRNIGGKDFAHGEVYPALIFTDMRPANILNRIMAKMINSYFNYKYMFISSENTANKVLADKIEILAKNSVINMYKDCMESNIIKINMI